MAGPRALAVARFRAQWLGASDLQTQWLQVTLDLVPEYDVLQAIYGTMGPEEHHPIEILLDNFDSLLSEHDSVSVMVDWPRDDVGMVVARTFGPPGVPITPNSDWNGIPLVTDPLPPLLGSGREFPSTCQVCPPSRGFLMDLDLRHQARTHMLARNRCAHTRTGNDVCQIAPATQCNHLPRTAQKGTYKYS